MFWAYHCFGCDNFGILEDLHDDVSSALAELQHVKERRTDTLSFKELLANCDALYKLIEDGIRKLELQLQQYGYTPVETPKYIHREAVEYPSHQKLRHSQNPFEAISPPRSWATLSSINDYKVSIDSYGSLTANQDYQKRYLEILESLEVWKALVFRPPVSQRWLERLRMVEEEDNLKTKYSSHWNSEVEIKLPLLPNIPTTKFGSISGNDNRHLRPIISDKPESKYGIGTTNLAPTSIISKKGSFAKLLCTSSSNSEHKIFTKYTMTPNPGVQILDVL